MTVINTSTNWLKLSSATKPEDVIKLLGAPSNAWNDNVEHCLEYCTADVSLRLIWDVKTTFWMRGLKYKSAEIEFGKPCRPSPR